VSQASGYKVVSDELQEFSAGFLIHSQKLAIDVLDAHCGVFEWSSHLHQERADLPLGDASGSALLVLGKTSEYSADYFLGVGDVGHDLVLLRWGYRREGSDYAGNFLCHGSSVGCAVDVLAVHYGCLSGGVLFGTFFGHDLGSSFGSLCSGKPKISCGDGSNEDSAVSKALFAIPDHGPTSTGLSATFGSAFASKHYRAVFIDGSAGGEEKRD
jgi:hypothetical protein